MAGQYLILWSVFLILLGWTALRKMPKGSLPGPCPIPFLGSLLQLGKLPHRSLAKLAHRHGPLMSVQLGLVHYIFVSSPAIAKQVLIDQDQAVSHRVLSDAFWALDHNKLSMTAMSPGSLWRSLRKICNSHIFSSQRLEENQVMRSRKVRELVLFLEKSARAGEPVDVGRAVFTTTLNLISTTIFSEDMVKYEEESSAEFKDLIRQVMIEIGSPNISDYFPPLRWLDLQGRRRRLGLHLLKMRNIFDKKIEDRQTSGFAKTSSDFLSVLLDANTSQELDRHVIGALLVDLFVAGSDTSSTTVEWSMTELLRNPTCLEKARQEVAEAMGDSQKEEVAESDTSRMPYLQAVLKETLRLHPPVPLIPRRTSKTVEVTAEAEKGKTSRYIISAGSNFTINVWAIGRDPSSWGTDADRFRPERFLEDDTPKVDYRGRNMELMPFGGGRRLCPGLPLALRMVHLMLANLLWFFDWKLPGGMAPEDISMADKYGLSMSKAEPLVAVPILARHTTG